jgi:hypothetical protein
MRKVIVAMQALLDGFREGFGKAVLRYEPATA